MSTLSSGDASGNIHPHACVLCLLLNITRVRGLGGGGGIWGTRCGEWGH